MCICILQNSPELDEEGYSIRPEEPGYILSFYFNFNFHLLSESRMINLGFAESAETQASQVLLSLVLEMNKRHREQPDH